VTRYFKRISTPGAIPQMIAVSVSFIAILAIFALDVMTGSEIVLQILYIFPIVMTSFHCERKALVVGAVVLSVVLQAVTLVTYDIATSSKIIEMLMILWSDILVAIVSYYARSILLQNVPQKKVD
jgi:hypothetical protein